MGEDPTVRYAYQQIGVPERAPSHLPTCAAARQRAVPSNADST